ncbi:hypothetical protein BTE48_03620 [Oceanospirillum multiglobuliferum]|uniref:Toprim domain-containing protein n=2 Tax=Oceanospirillum multiglobuliferum TaxID=64969 RepID=A0A1V4T7R9_9GAMM|nr:hypothetical protein BTE48_03620 [Oceanospirillum multiglobuliferum]
MVEDQFKAAMLKDLGAAPNHVNPSKITRFDDPKGKRGNNACYCQLFLDDCHPAGYFGNWRTGHYQTWICGGKPSMTRSERKLFDQKLAEAKRQREQETRQRQQAAREKAFKLISRATPADPQHPYLVNKQVGAHDLMQLGNTLLVPLFADDQLVNLQRIYRDESGQIQKRFLSGGRMAGAFAFMGLCDAPTAVYICEGWATGATIYEDTGQAVLCAMNANNLKAVATFARNRWPSAALTVCADDDRLLAQREGINVGMVKAREAAIATDALLVAPDWPIGAPEHLTDFNDLANWMNGGSL